MQVVQGGDGGGEVALRVVQLLYVSGDLFDLQGTPKEKQREMRQRSVIDSVKIKT